jgi:hypothetical protein
MIVKMAKIDKIVMSPNVSEDVGKVDYSHIAVVNGKW